MTASNIGNSGLPASFAPIVGVETKRTGKAKTALQAVRLTLPSSESLGPVVQSLQSDLAAPSGDLGLVHSAFENEPKRLCEWLYGKWLEHHILNVLHELADSLRLHEYV